MTNATTEIREFLRRRDDNCETKIKLSIKNAARNEALRHRELPRDEGSDVTTSKLWNFSWCTAREQLFWHDRRQ